MKTSLLLILAFSFGLQTIFAFDMEELLKWEKAAQIYLNDSELEIYSLEVSDKEITFKYDVVDTEYPYLDIVFECVGEGRVENGQPSFSTLTCEEEEPTLWDEF